MKTNFVVKQIYLEEKKIETLFSWPQRTTLHIKTLQTTADVKLFAQIC